MGYCLVGLNAGRGLRCGSLITHLQNKTASPSLARLFRCPWGRVLLLYPVSNPERQSTGIEHRSGCCCHQGKRVPFTRVLTTPFGLDRSPALDEPKRTSAGEISEYHNTLNAPPTCATISHRPRSSGLSGYSRYVRWIR